MRAKSRSRLTRTAEIILIQCQSLTLTREFDGGVEVHRFVQNASRKLTAGLLQFFPPPDCWKTGNPKENLAPNNRAREDTVSFVQPSDPFLNSQICPHQFADGIRIKQVCHWR